MAGKVQYACGICGGIGKKHLKHCPVPKLTKNQVNWIVAASMARGPFPLY